MINSVWEPAVFPALVFKRSHQVHSAFKALKPWDFPLRNKCLPDSFVSKIFILIDNFTLSKNLSNTKLSSLKKFLVASKQSLISFGHHKCFWLQGSFVFFKGPQFFDLFEY